MDTVVEFKAVSKKYSNRPVLKNIQLSVEKDDFMVVYGLPSSGKTVLFRLLMGARIRTAHERHPRTRVVLDHVRARQRR